MPCYREEISRVEPLDSAVANFKRSQACMISAIICIRFVEIVTSVICQVLVYCFGSFLLQDMF